MNEKKSRKILLFLTILGFAFAAFSALADHLPWLSALCAGVFDGCKETARFSLLRIPLWAWGLVFYAALATTIYGFPRLFSWLLAVGIGFEASLVAVSLSMKIICIFCIGNFVVIVFLVPFAFAKDMFWRTLALASLSFMFSAAAVGYPGNPLQRWGNESSPQVVGRIGGEDVRRDEVEDPLAASLYDLELQKYNLKKQQLENVLDMKILQKEAEALGVPLNRFIGEIVNLRTVQVSDAEISQYIQKNSDRFRNWAGSPEDLKKQTEILLQNQKARSRIGDHAKTLHGKYDVAVYLKEPVYPLIRVNVDGDPFWGPSNATVTIVEFSDYQCPACRDAHKVVRGIRETYKDRVKWVFKDYPLKRNTGSDRAAEAARCADEQGKFTQYQDLLFDASQPFTPGLFVQIAEKLGLETSRFRQCLESGRHAGKVLQNLSEGQKIGVNSVPSFVVNGRVVTGVPKPDQFKKAIDQALGGKGQGSASP